MPDSYLYLDSTTGLPTSRALTVTSTGAPNAGDGVALDSDGKLNSTVMPSGLGADSQAILATENLAAGNWITIYNDPGTSNEVCRKALAIDTTRPAHAYVKAAVSAGSIATAFFEGRNSLIPAGSLTAADVGKRAFLSASTAGATTITPPTGTPGALVQFLGTIASYNEADSTVSVKPDFNSLIVA
jgi:hypothetical protein